MPARALQGQLVAAFSVQELRELVETRLGEDPAQIWGEDVTVNEAAGELVAWARRRGRLCDLASAAAAARPQNETLAAAARLMPLVSEGGRRVGTPPVEESEARVADPGEYGNGVQRTLGRVETQIDALRADVADMRAELAAQRADSAKRAAGQRAQLWLTLVLVVGVLTTAGALAAHVLP